MKALLASLLLAAVTITAAAVALKAKRKPVGRCQPYEETCLHCTDCRLCQHCAGKGGKCSVCWEK